MGKKSHFVIIQRNIRFIVEISRWESIFLDQSAQKIKTLDSLNVVEEKKIETCIFIRGK